MECGRLARARRLSRPALLMRTGEDARPVRAGRPHSLDVVHAEAFSAWHYLLSGGFSKPALYPAVSLKCLQVLDRRLSRWPKLFGARCVVGLSPDYNRLVNQGTSTAR